MLITLEGIDGTGKTTQLRLLAKYLDEQGYKIHVTKEPGDDQVGSCIGMGIRRLLFARPGTAKMAPGVGDLLFLADHVQNEYDVRQKLEEGAIVLCDRYADSQYAYMAAPGNNSPFWAGDFYKERYGTIPTVTFLFVARGQPKSMSVVTEGKLGFHQIQGMEDISWALQRANRSDPDKQAGKSWNKVDEQMAVQLAYVSILSGEPRTKIIHVWESTSSEHIHELLVSILRPLLPSKE